MTSLNVNRTGTRRHAPRPRPFALSIALAWAAMAAAPGAAQAQVTPVLPTGPSVVQGTASVVRQGSQMTVTNSAQAILNWQSFSIGAGGSVRFEQPNASSRVLNRVLGNDPSAIFGQLSSNGQVWLLNPNGVLFGAGSRVDVGGLVASTLNLSDQDWLGQRDWLRAPLGGNGAEASVTNQGTLRASTGGRIVLAGAGAVRNEGVIEAIDGHVVLAAGRSVDLLDTQTPYVALRVQAPAGEALNLGRIDAGRIDLQGAIVNQQGLLRATSLNGEGGQIELRASSALNLAAGSQTLAEGSAQGGRIVADAGRAGTLMVDGEVRADASAASGTGGRIEALGQRVGLTDTAQLAASGAGGGGRILIGGGLQGRDASVPNAESVYVAPGAQVSADATQQGDGGRIYLWSNKATRAYGRFSARGGASGGDGGFIETSGGWLDARPSKVDTQAPKGRAGEWLIDPNDLFISDTIPDRNISVGPDFTTTADNAVITTSTIANALLSGNNVTLTTASGGTEAGDIIMNGANLTVGLSVPVTLTLNAWRDIWLTNSTIRSTTPAPLSLVFNPNRSGLGAGANYLFASEISTQGGGSISLTGGFGYAGYQLGTSIFGNSRVAAPGGTIFLGGQGYAGADGSGQVSGVSIGSGSIVSARDITITGAVNSNSPTAERYGVLVNAATVAAERNLTINGTATSTTAWPDLGTPNSVYGVRIYSGLISVQPGAGPAGAMVVNGTVSEGPVTGSGTPLTRFGLKIDGPALSSPTSTLTVTGGSTLNLAGFSSAGSPTTSLSISAPSSIDAAAGGAVTIQAQRNADISPTNIVLPSGAAATFSAGTSLGISTQMTGSPSSLSLSASGIATVSGGINLGGSGSVTLSSVALNLGKTDGSEGLQLATAGTVSASSTSSTLRSYGTTNLTSTGTGSPLIVRAVSGAALSSATTLTTPNGRWLVYTNDPSDFSAPGLAYDFRQYNAPAETPPAASGNALMFSRVATLSLFSGTLTKVYDGSPTYTLTGGPEVIGQVGGDRLTNQFFFANANAGTGKQLNPGNGTNDPGVRDNADKFVYGYIADSSLLGSITTRPVTLSGVTAANKVYDGTTATTLSGGTLSGLVSGQSLGFTLGSGAFADANAGVGKAVTGTGTLLDGTGGIASNYQLTGITTTGTITQRPVTLTGVVAASKVYDGTTTATLSGGTLSGQLSGQSLGFSLGSGAFADANAGVGKTVTGSAALLDGTGAIAANYQLTSTAVTTTGTITQRPVTLTGVVAASKVYDGTTSATFSGGTLSGEVSGQSLGFSLGSGVFADANAGVGKAVTGSAALLDGTGAIAANYQLTSTAVTTTATITPRTVTVAGVTAATKVYDGTTAATLAGGTLSGVLGGENLTLNLSGGTFATADAGVGKTAAGTLALANGVGGIATNYQLASTAVTTTGTITPRLLTLTGVIAADKVYDGTTTATLSGGTLSGQVPGQSLGLSLGSGAFADANAGAGKTVTGSASLVNGAGGTATNYQLVSSAVTTTGTITPRTVTVTGVTAATKVYDGATTAALAGGALSGVLAGESLTLNLSGGAFATADAGVGKTVTGALALSDGAGGIATNYQLASTAVTTTGTITQRPVTLSGVVAADKVYDGNTATLLTGGTLSGLIEGQDLVPALSIGTFADANAGVGKTVTGSVALLNGATGAAANYQLTSTAISATATITPKPLTLAGVVAANKVYDGTPTATLSGGTLTGLIAGEDLTIALGAGTFASAAAGTAKTVTGTGSLGNGTAGLAANYLLGSGAITTTADITPRTVTVTGVTAETKVYDGTIAATLAGGTLGGVLAGEDLTLNRSGGAFATADAGLGKTVTGTLALANGTAGTATNYQLASSAITTTGTITQRPVTVSGVVGSNRVYDGTTVTLLSGATLSGLVPGQDLVATLSVGSFADANAGVDKAVTGSVALLNGVTGNAANYRLTSTAINTTGTIAPQALTLTGVVAANKVYDGTTAATLSGGTLTGLVAGENLSIALGVGTFASAAAGTAKTVTGTGTLANGTNGLAANYLLGTGAITTTADITPRTVTVAGVTAATKVYDGTTVATLAGGTLSGVLAGEDLTLNRSGTFDTANAGVGKTVTGTLALANGTAGTATNYQLASSAVTTTGTITPKALTLAGVVAANKVYDGTTAATLSGGTLTGIVPGEDLTIALGAGTFASAAAGTAKTVTGTGALGNGTTGLAANYQLGSGAITTTADITPRTVTVAGLTADTKVYDGTTTATLVGGTLSGVLAGEDLTLNRSGSFGTPDAGVGKIVTATLALANGTAGTASNYQLASAAVTTTGTITQRPVTLSGVLAADKIYDGNTATLLSGGVLSGLVAGQDLVAALSIGSFTDANAGVGKAVTGSVALLNGTTGTAANYQLTSTVINTTATITPKALSLAGVTAANKVYDGNTLATLSGGTLTGLVVGEDLAITLGAGSFATAAAGEFKTVTGTGTLANGTTGRAANYTLTSGSIVAEADITQRPVTVSGVTAVTKVYDATSAATLTGGTIAGLVPGENLTLTPLGGSFDTANAGVGKAVVGTVALADGTTGTAANYRLAGPTVNTTGTITPKPVTITGVTATDKVYDGLTTATVAGGTVLGTVGDDTIGVSLGAANFNTANAGTAKPVIGAATLVSGQFGLASNYQLTGGFSTTGNILQRPVTVTGVTVTPKTYDGSTAAALTGGSVSGLVGTEDLRVVLGAAGFITADAGLAKPVVGTAALADGTAGLAANYQLLSGTLSAVGDITPKTVTLGGVTAANKVYDGLRTASVSGGVLSGLVGTETLGLTLSGASFDTANAGTAKPVTATAALADGSSGRAANYVLASAAVSTTADVARKAVTVTGVTAADKTYDGTTAATLSGGTITGLVGNESLALKLSSGSFDTANAGIGKTVTGSVAVADGPNGLAANYQLPVGAVTTTASITPKPVSLASVQVAPKVYDGTTEATLSAGSLIGLVASEDLRAVVAGGFSSAAAGTGKAVTGTATLVNGTTGLAANYQLTGAGSITALGDITPRSVTVSGVTAADKVYDGLTRATLAGGTVSGLVGSDDLQLSVSVGAFDTANVGVGKAVTGSVALTNGTRGVASNYQLATAVVTTSASITPRTITLSGVTAANKVYDGSTAATLSGGTLSGLVAGEDLVLALGAARFSDPNAGVGKSVTASAAVTNGRFGLATNYVLAPTTVSTTANIDRALLTYVANGASGIFGVDRPPLSGTVVGFVTGETLGTSTTGTLAFTTPATPASAPGAYPINGGGLSAQNYQFVDAPQNATAYLQQAGRLDTPNDVDQRIANVGPKLFPNPTRPSTPTVGRALDSLPSLVPPTIPNGQSAFAAIDRANLSQDEIAGVLAARSRLKKLVFAPAIEKLVEDPTLADAPACVSIEQAENGNCLLTERIRDLARIRAGRTALAPMQPETAPTATAAATTPANPSPQPAAVTTAAAPAAPAAPTEALAVGRALPLVGAIAPLRAILDPVMPAQRRVRLAVLPEIQRKVAVLIGNDKYADSRIPALNNAGSDARAVAATLEKSLGYETVVLKDATRAEILRTLNRLALELEPQDSVVIYYAGHGELIEATGQGYWQPSDADATRPETWISNNDIGRLMRLFGSRQVAMVSDSCFSGSLLGEDRIRGVNTTSDPKQLLQRRAAVVMTSGGNEPVFDAGRDGHSPFAWNLMRTIEKVSNWRPGSNLFESVRFAVARELPQRPQYGSSRLGGHESGSDYVFEQRELEGRN